MSNRQVWNNAAMMAAALLTGDRADGGADRHRARSGVEAHLATGLLEDGTWYEGENYHLFAHRGLWYCVALAEAASIRNRSAADGALRGGFRRALRDGASGFHAAVAQGFAVRDLASPAAICRTLRARDSRVAADERLVGALAELYADGVPRGDTNRTRSTADVERNLPGTGPHARRSGLAVAARRAAIAAVARAPRAAVRAPRRTGNLGVTGATAAASTSRSTGGSPAAGTAIPIVSNLLFSHGATRWLDDLGTGPYVDPSLHWYRSTLAHNAPLIDGRSQLRVDGELLAHDERGGVGWTFAEADGLSPGVRVTRAVIVTPDYFVDEVRWRAGRDVRLRTARFTSTVRRPASTGAMTGRSTAAKPRRTGSGSCAPRARRTSVRRVRSCSRRAPGTGPRARSSVRRGPVPLVHGGRAGAAREASRARSTSSAARERAVRSAACGPGRRGWRMSGAAATASRWRSEMSGTCTIRRGNSGRWKCSPAAHGAASS